MSTDPRTPSPGDDLDAAAPGSPRRRLLERFAPQLRSAQPVMVGIGLLELVLGFLASIDIFLLPAGPEAAAWLLHPLLLILGAAGGLASAIRGRQIDRDRWEIVEDPLLTGGERELAHREAERERRWAGTVFLVVPVFLGYWMAYQFQGSEGGSPLSFLLTASPTVGFVLGLLIGQRLLGPEEAPY